MLPSSNTPGHPILTPIHQRAPVDEESCYISTVYGNTLQWPGCHLLI
jgi:hypothetical protein